MPDPVAFPNVQPDPVGQTTTYGENANMSQTGQQTGTNTGQSTQLNQYSAAQQALQSQLAGQYGGFLSGQTQVPAYMTAPPQVFDAWNEQFNKEVAPGLAAQFGGNSPQIHAQRAYGNRQLAAQLYQGGITNWLNGLGAANNFALTPQGSNLNSTASNALNNQTDSSSGHLGIQSNTMGGSLLALLLSLMGG